MNSSFLSLIKNYTPKTSVVEPKKESLSQFNEFLSRYLKEEDLQQPSSNNPPNPETPVDVQKDMESAIPSGDLKDKITLSKIAVACCFIDKGEIMSKYPSLKDNFNNISNVRNIDSQDFDKILSDVLTILTTTGKEIPENLNLNNINFATKSIYINLIKDLIFVSHKDSNLQTITFNLSDDLEKLEDVADVNAEESEKLVKQIYNNLTSLLSNNIIPGE
jgi:hypothetical protein